MASSSYSSPPTPAVFPQSWKYHVFLSFRGEDTRTNFVDHLYTALKYKGIHTYKDDVTLPWGESINPSLKKAIRESRSAVIVFSENYANSSWCLNELEYIMKCKDKRGQTVFAIFYRVDPSEVRKQKGKYGEAFAKYELENNEKVKSWRKALADASNISGWDPERIANGHESQAIKIIVDTISDSLPPITTIVNNDLVGVKDRMQHLMPKLQIGSGGKIMIGIWGVGGGGKTTLATCIYNEISGKFEGCCFIKNIREESSNKNGLKKLQEEILCGVLKENKMKLQRVEEERDMIKDRLHHLRVLIVLDDVDNLDHLDELAGSHDWFGEGSRIIITTRNQHVLTGHIKIDVIHDIRLLNNDEAMELFCKHAPRGHRCIEDYEQLSKNVVCYAGGLPLALRVLGRFLCNKEINEWRSALDRLNDCPNDNILEVLKFSYDGLTALEKELFLHIACFFSRHCYKNEGAMEILDACGFHPVIGVKVLIERALITISEDGRFEMHDLIEEMAHYIVRGEHPDNPETHSRVWKQKDVRKICAMDATTNFDKIKAIVFDYGSDDESLRYLQTLTNMKKLRWLDVMCNPWDEYTWTLPENFPPGELYCLTMYGLKAKQYWEGHKFLPNLRMIKLDFLDGLITTPNCNGLPNLEIFMVKNTWSLQEIHPSFGCLEKLVFVAIESCQNLKMVPPITRSEKLETFILSYCPSLLKFSEVQQCMKNRKYLQEPSVAHHNISPIGLRSFNGSLRKLDLSCSGLGDEDISSDAVWDLPELQELNLEGNEDISRLIFHFLRAPRLKLLNVSRCYDLEELSELPSSIAVVIADECRSLKTFGDISNCKWLWKVSLSSANFHGGDTLLHSMLEGNAKDYFISIVPCINIWRGVIPWLNWVKPFTMRLPHDWYNKFSGLLVFFRTTIIEYLDVKINIKQGIDEDFQFEFGQKSNEIPGTPYYYATAVGYVSFNSLRHTGCLDSTYNMVSISLAREEYWNVGECSSIRVELIPKDDPMQTEFATDWSEFGHEKPGFRKPFTIKHDSNSSIEILWTPP